MTTGERIPMTSRRVKTKYCSLNEKKALYVCLCFVEHVEGIFVCEGVSCLNREAIVHFHHPHLKLGSRRSNIFLFQPTHPHSTQTHKMANREEGYGYTAEVAGKIAGKYNAEQG